MVVNAFLFIGLDLTARDKLHAAWDGRRLVLKMGALVLAGSLLTWVLCGAAGRIALASVVAFALAATVDALVYHRTRSVLVSNVASGLVDSVVFPTLAFGAFMPLVVGGQWLAKVAGGWLWWRVLRQK